MTDKHSDWLTIEEVKARTGLPEAAIRRAAGEGRLASARRGGKKHGPEVYDPRRVEEWAAEARGAGAQVLPPENDGRGTLVRSSEAAEWSARLEAFLGRAARAIAEMAEDETAGETRGGARLLPPSELRHKLYLTEAEARHYTGLGLGYLRKHLDGKAIGPRGSIVYRRSSLDKL